MRSVRIKKQQAKSNLSRRSLYSSIPCIFSVSVYCMWEYELNWFGIRFALRRFPCASHTKSTIKHIRCLCSFNKTDQRRHTNQQRIKRNHDSTKKKSHMRHDRSCTFEFFSPSREFSFVPAFVVVAPSGQTIPRSPNTIRISRIIFWRR